LAKVTLCPSVKGILFTVLKDVDMEIWFNVTGEKRRMGKEVDVRKYRKKPF